MHRLTCSSSTQVTVGVGYIGHVLLTQLLLDKLKESAPARIVWVTASAKIKATLDWDDLGWDPSHPWSSVSTASQPGEFEAHLREIDTLSSLPGVRRWM